jgi:hypothetical protein
MYYYDKVKFIVVFQCICWFLECCWQEFKKNFDFHFCDEDNLVDPPQIHGVPSPRLAPCVGSYCGLQSFISSASASGPFNSSSIEQTFAQSGITGRSP